MIAELAECVPASLAAYGGGIAMRPGSARARPLSALRDRRVFDETLSVFGAGLGGAAEPLERRALVSYWSQFYFAVLATPALTALARLERSLPLAFEEMSLELDEAGRPACLLIANGRLDGTSGLPCDRMRGLSGLVDEHLRPFVALCSGHCGLAPRVLWGNAAAIFDYVAGELGEDAVASCGDITACLGRDGVPACATSPLAKALCPGAAGCRRRRVCCLRQTLPGIPSCGALCPLECDDRA
jgi:ferric iron reductase protein FhuF